MILWDPGELFGLVEKSRQGCLMKQWPSQETDRGMWEGAQESSTCSSLMLSLWVCPGQERSMWGGTKVRIEKRWSRRAGGKAKNGGPSRPHSRYVFVWQARDHHGGDMARFVFWRTLWLQGWHTWTENRAGFMVMHRGLLCTGLRILWDLPTRRGQLYMHWSFPFSHYYTLSFLMKSPKKPGRSDKWRCYCLMRP